MNAAARVLSGTRKFDRGLTQLTHAELHWLDVLERVKYKLSMVTRRCLNDTAPHCLAAHWHSMQSLRLLQDSIYVLLPVISLVVPSYQLSSYGSQGSSLLPVRRRRTHYLRLWTFTEDIFLFRVLIRVATNLENLENLEYSGISLNMENSGNSVQPQGKIVTGKVF